eukprot:m.20981 g.20981  ORF g.20981 m.20981 type:complete len:153 (+) comp11081_c0_seq3:669-1127(+)
MSSNQSSQTVQVSAGSLKKNSYVMVKGHPCKVINLSKFKPGKHGHAKVHIIATDIFDQRRHEVCVGCQHDIETPFVSSEEYLVNNISEEGYLSLMDDSGAVREDLRLSAERSLDAELLAEYKSISADGEQVLEVMVLRAVSQEMIMGFRVVD